MQVDGGPLQTLSVGEKSMEGVLLVSIDGDVATFDIRGKRVAVALGLGRVSAGPSAAAAAVVYANRQGQFLTDGLVNGRTVRFLVDTGATVITLPASEARRLRLDYRNGRKGMTRTANGDAPVYRIKLDTVRVGDITLYGVDALVMDSENLSQALLGMSFLDHLEMTREGGVMRLTKRY